MQAMVLAAGFGERLRPLTEKTPKPALPLFDQTVMGRVLGQLAASGARRIVFNTHHLADQVAQVAEQARPAQIELIRSHEPSLLGTAGALRQASDLLEREPLVVVNGDVLHDVDLPRLVALHRARRAKVTLVVRRDPEAEAFGALGVDEEGWVRRILRWVAPGSGREGLRTVMFTGLQVVEPAVLDEIPPGFSSTTEDLYPRLLERGEPIFGYLHEGYWLDVGTPERYLRVHWDMLEGALGPRPLSRWRPPSASSLTLQEPYWVAEDACLEPRCHLGPLAVVGSGCHLGAGAVVSRSLLLPGVEVGPRTLVEGCLVASGVRLPAGESFKESLIALDGEGRLRLSPLGPGGEAA
jgi:NDP-sugar pyrophosphorylase family protein